MTKEEQLYYTLSMTFLSTKKTEEEEKRRTVTIVRKTPKKEVGRRSRSRSTKKRKNENFETAQQPDIDINMDDKNDEDLSDYSDNFHSLSL